MEKLQWESFPTNLETSYHFTENGHIKFMIVEVSDGFRLLIERVEHGKILLTLCPNATTLEECKSVAEQYVHHRLPEYE